MPVVSNQIRFNILDRRAETSGLLETCKELNVTCMAYEPLSNGLLTGKYTDPERLVSPGRKYTTSQLAYYKQLTNLMKFVGSMQGRAEARSITEVALGYCIAKGVVPVAGVKTEGHARELIRAMDPCWSLDADYVGVLDEKSEYLARQRA